MQTETKMYAVVRVSGKYGPSTDYLVVSVHDEQGEAAEARSAADAGDRHPGTGLRELGHNESGRHYALAEVVAETGSSIDWDHAEGHCEGDLADVLRGADWTDEQIERGCDGDDEALERGIDAMLASAGLIGACDARGDCYILRLVDA